MSPVATTFVVIATAPEMYSGTPAACFSCAPRMTNSTVNKTRRQ